MNLTDNNIPKILHQIWICCPIPDKWRRFCYETKKLHINWDYRLWTDVLLSTLKRSLRLHYGFSVKRCTDDVN